MYIGLEEGKLNQAHDSLATVFASLSIVCLIVATMGIKFRLFRHQLNFDGTPASKNNRQLERPTIASTGIYRSKALDEDYEEPVQLRNPQPSTSQQKSKKQSNHESIFRFPFRNKLSVSKFETSASLNEPAISSIQAKQESLVEKPQKSAETLRKNEKIIRMVSQTLDRNSLNAPKAITAERSKIDKITTKVENSKVEENSNSENISTLSPESTFKLANSANSENEINSQAIIFAPMPPKRISKEVPLARPRLRATESIDTELHEVIDFGEQEIFKKVKIIEAKPNKAHEEIKVVEPEIENITPDMMLKEAEVKINVPEIIFTESKDNDVQQKLRKISFDRAELESDFSDIEESEPIEIILIGSKSAIPKSEPIPIIQMAPPPPPAIRNSPKASVSFKTDIETISTSSYSSLEDFVQASSEFYDDPPRKDTTTPTQLKSILKSDQEDDDDDMFNSWVQVDKHRQTLDNYQHSKPPPLPKTPPPALEDREEFIYEESPVPARVIREALI